jgi:hypothetical protein
LCESSVLYEIKFRIFVNGFYPLRALVFSLMIYFCSFSRGGFAARFRSCAKGRFFSTLCTGQFVIFPLTNFWPPSRSDREQALAASGVPMKLGPDLAHPSRFSRGALFLLPVFSRRQPDFSFLGFGAFTGARARSFHLAVDFCPVRLCWAVALKHAGIFFRPHNFLLRFLALAPGRSLRFPCRS